MTKLPHYATKLRLSKICRWLLALGLVKFSVLAALVLGYPLPEVSLDFWGFSRPAAVQEDHTAKPPAPVLVAITPSVRTEAQPEAQIEPQGSAAARAAAAVRPNIPNAHVVSHVVTAAPITLLESTVTPVPVHSTQVNIVNKDADADAAWWKNILQLRHLPIPRLGADQAAYAATLDSPPPPQVTQPQENSPFVPPAQNTQNIPKGQNPDGSPLPPRSTTARPLPAGTSVPQVITQPNTLPQEMIPNDSPPAPRVDAYTPPDDPHRKQQELARQEQDVLMLKQQMEQRLQELQQAEQKVQDMLREAKGVEDKKLTSLTGMYVNMKPKAAAKAMEALDDRIAVKILSNMTPKQSGEILTYMDPARTAKLTELLSRMRIGQ